MNKQQNGFWKNPKDTRGFAACDRCKGGQSKELNDPLNKGYVWDTWQNGKITLCDFHYFTEVGTMTTRVTCHVCRRTWNTKSSRALVTCPDCGYKTQRVKLPVCSACGQPIKTERSKQASNA